MNPQRLVLAMTGCVLAVLSSACQLDLGMAERDAPRVAQESSPVQKTEAVSPELPINGGYPYFADVDLQVSGTPEVGGQLTVTAYFTVPVDSLALKPGSSEFDLVVGLYFGDHFIVTAVAPRIEVVVSDASDWQTGVVRVRNIRVGTSEHPGEIR